MTILDVAVKVALKVGIAVPAALYALSDRTSLELKEVLQESADYIRDAYDWQAFKVISSSIVGDGTTEDFNLPADWARMLKKSTLFPSSSPATPLRHVLDSDQWLALKVNNFNPSPGDYTIYGGQVHITPAPDTAEIVKFFYITNKIVLTNGAVQQATFTADTDSFRLDERLLRLCAIWKWKAAKKNPFAQEFDDYEEALDKAVIKDKGSKILVVGRQRMGADVDVAYPRAVL